MLADGNTKPLQGHIFRVIGSMLTGIDSEYDDDIEHKNTHPMLLPYAEAEEVISPSRILKF